MPRRLPVVQNEASEDAEAASRPRFHWVLIGAGLTLTLWAPLLILSLPLGPRLAARAVGTPPGDVASVVSRLSPREFGTFAFLSILPGMVSFFVGSSLGGLLVGRFGGRAGPREAASGAAAAAALISLVCLRPGLGYGAPGIAVGFAVLSTLGALGGALGGAWGRRLRR